jgi:hypothetical protein
MQIGGRVRWWDAMGKIKYGTVQAINVLSDVRSWTDSLLADADMFCN